MNHSQSWINEYGTVGTGTYLVPELGLGFLTIQHAEMFNKIGKESAFAVADPYLARSRLADTIQQSENYNETFNDA